MAINTNLKPQTMPGKYAAKQVECNPYLKTENVESGTGAVCMQPKINVELRGQLQQLLQQQLQQLQSSLRDYATKILQVWFMSYKPLHHLIFPVSK